MPFDRVIFVKILNSKFIVYVLFERINLFCQFVQFSVLTIAKIVKKQ